MSSTQSSSAFSGASYRKPPAYSKSSVTKNPVITKRTFRVGALATRSVNDLSQVASYSTPTSTSTSNTISLATTTKTRRRSSSGSSISSRKSSNSSSSSSNTSRTRARASSVQLHPFTHSQFLFTPADLPSLTAPSSSAQSGETKNKIKFRPQKSVSSPLLPLPPHPPPLYSVYPPKYSPPSNRPRELPMRSDSDEDDDEQLIYTAWQKKNSRSQGQSQSRKSMAFVTNGAYHNTSTKSSSMSNLRTRIFGGNSSIREKPRVICTTPGHDGAGETETETDEPSRNLPTARIPPSTSVIIRPSDVQARVTPLLFEFCRFLSIVPAVLGIVYNAYMMTAYSPMSTSLAPGRRHPERTDYFVSILWALLTGHQSLALATGLLTRWRLYYPPLATLIRLLALQLALCWPAVHTTMKLVGVRERPEVVWAVIGTSTCISRALQIWITSNLWWEGTSGGGGGSSTNLAAAGIPGGQLSDSGSGKDAKEVGGGGGGAIGNVNQRARNGYWRRWRGGKWGARRWDWGEVTAKCMLPAGILYFVMTWAEVLRREWSGC